MSRSLKICAFLVALAHVVGGCSDNQGAASSEPQKKVEAAKRTAAAAPLAADEKLILAFGDSLYAGYGVPQNDSFPHVLEETLGGEGLNVRVHNAGVSGDTTAAARQRLVFTLDGLPRTPDLAIVGLGGNDMLRGLSPADTRSNLVAILDELKKRSIPIVLTGMVAAPNMGRDYGDAFNPIYADLARDYDAALYPFFLDGVITDSTLMQADGLHPNEKGIDKIVDRVAPLIAKSLSG